MATRSRHEGDHHFAGDVSFESVTFPNGVVDDDSIEAGANIDAAKLEHRNHAWWSQPNTAATTETRVIHVVYGATGVVIAFRAGSIAKAVGDSTVTVDLKKNGTTLLTAVITLDTGNTNRVAEAGTLVGSPTLVTGDVLEVVITATIGTGTLPTGVFCDAVLDEEAD